MDEYSKATRRKIYVVNLDPAAEHFNYDVAFDIREMITVEEVAKEMKLGPNGALIFCMQFLVNNIEWLKGKLDEFASDDVYFMFDCPGQIELYTHLNVMTTISKSLQEWGFRVGCAWMVDATFVTDAAKFLSGSLVALSAMIHLELPHLNVLTKADLVRKKSAEDSSEEDPLASFTSPVAADIADGLNKSVGLKFKKLNFAMAEVLDSFKLVGFVPMSIKDENTISVVMAHLDNAVQYGDDVEPTALDRDAASKET